MNTLKLTAAAIALAVAGSVYAGGGAAMSAPAAPKAPAQSQQKMFVRMGFGGNDDLYKSAGKIHTSGDTGALNAKSFGVGYNMGKLAVVVSLNSNLWSDYDNVKDATQQTSLEIAPEYHMNMGGAELVGGLGIGFALLGTDHDAYSKADIIINPYVGIFGKVSNNVKVGGTLGYTQNDHSWARVDGTNTEAQSGLTYTFSTQIGF